MQLTAATYNIAAGLIGGLLGKKDYYKTADIIKQIDADIITLNEVGKPLPDYIDEHAKFLADYCGYKYYAFAKATSFGKFPYGNALLSKLPIENVKVIPIKKFVQLLPGIYEPRCILCADVKADKQLRIVCTHLGLMPDEQKLGLRKLQGIISAADNPTILTGDFNISCGSKRIDTIKDIMKDVCEKSNIVVNTFPSTNPRKRLDYIFVSDNINIEEVTVYNTPASDHLPLAARLSL